MICPLMSSISRKSGGRATTLHPSVSYNSSVVKAQIPTLPPLGSLLTVHDSSRI